MKWQQTLHELHMKHMRTKTPNAFAAAGGLHQKPRLRRDRTANGLTKAIMEFIKYKGWYCERHSVQGQYDPKLKKWRYGSGTKGSADIHATINGRSFFIEVKVGKDKLSERQIEVSKQQQKAG